MLPLSVKDYPMKHVLFLSSLLIFTACTEQQLEELRNNTSDLKEIKLEIIRSETEDQYDCQVDSDDYNHEECMNDTDHEEETPTQEETQPEEDTDDDSEMNYTPVEVEEDETTDTRYTK